MNRTIYLSLLLLLGLAACNNLSSNSETASATTAISESERLNEWFAERYEEELQFSPVSLSYLGRKDRQSEIDDFSEQAEDEQLQWKRDSVKAMEAEFDYSKLTDEAKTSYDIWKYQLEMAEAGDKFRHHGYIFEQMGGLQSDLPNFLMNFHEVDSQADMEAYIARIGGIGDGIRQLLERSRKSAAKGIRPPKFALQGAIDQSAKLLDGQPFDKSAEQDAPLWANAQEKVAALEEKNVIDAESAVALNASAEKMLLNKFQPAYEELLSWLEAEKNNVSDEAHGASSLPDGAAYYDHQLAASTTTKLSADEVHNIGLSEVKRLRSEIESIKNSLNFDGDLKAFFAFVRSDPQFFFPDNDEGRQGYIDGAEGFINDIDAQLSDYFGLLPKAELVVKRVEAFREQDGAAQHYFPGTPDGKRPGVYYAHLSDMTAMPKNQMEVIAYHEGLPGHHMQISIAQELEAVPMFRTQARFTAYVEGWALYSEILAGEMGAYKDPYSKVGQLSSEIWRAIRLVVDTGLHAKGWTEEQAVQYFLANSPEPEESVRSEVRRYIVWPGQATSYKIGMLKILELREAARETMGDKFDIKAYHDTVLGGGALPLSLLERRVQDWASQ